MSGITQTKTRLGLAPGKAVRGWAVLVLCVCCLSACQTLTVPMKQALRTPDLPASFKAQLSPQTPAVTRQVHWWLALQDPQLDAWMTLALQRNRDLAKSALRVQKSVISAGKAARDAGPQTALALTSSAQAALKPRSASREADEGGGLGHVEPVSVAKTLSSSGWSFSVTQEVDLWGRVAQTKAQSEQDLLMAQADLQAAQWALTAQVAEQYWTLALLRHQIKAAELALQDAQANLAVQELLVQEGQLMHSQASASRLAVGQARRAQSKLLQQQQNALLAFALLMDEPPQDMALPAAELPMGMPEEPRAWPLASVLDRHPAVRRARLALEQSLSQLQLANIRLYPQLSLSGTVTSGGTELSKLLSNPIGQLALGLSLPILERTRLRKDVDTAQVNLEIAALEFRQVLYQALVEVDTHYGERQQWLAESALLRSQTAQAATALRVTRLRDENGLQTLQSVRQAAAEMRALELAALTLTSRAWLNHLAILRAWGGPL